MQSTDETTQRPVDPVCGMPVDPARAAGRAVHEGQEYWFCSKSCEAKFIAEPTMAELAAKCFTKCRRDMPCGVVQL